jgi:predicted Zn-dependent protease
MRAGDYDTARRILEENLEEKEAPVLHYQLACVEALAGNRERALDELAVAVDADERYREAAKTDEDFASIRDDPGFPA